MLIIYFYLAVSKLNQKLIFLGNSQDQIQRTARERAQNVNYDFQKRMILTHKACSVKIRIPHNRCITHETPLQCNQNKSILFLFILSLHVMVVFGLIFLKQTKFFLINNQTDFFMDHIRLEGKFVFTNPAINLCRTQPYFSVNARAKISFRDRVFNEFQNGQRTLESQHQKFQGIVKVRNIDNCFYKKRERNSQD